MYQVLRIMALPTDRHQTYLEKAVDRVTLGAEMHVIQTIQIPPEHPTLPTILEDQEDRRQTPPVDHHILAVRQFVLLLPEDVVVVGMIIVLALVNHLHHKDVTTYQRRVAEAGFIGTLLLALAVRIRRRQLQVRPAPARQDPIG